MGLPSTYHENCFTSAQGKHKSHSHTKEQRRKEYTIPFGVNLMRSQVLYQAAQESQPFKVYAGVELQLS